MLSWSFQLRTSYRGLRPRTPFFDAPVPAQGTDALRFACRRAGGGDKFFFRIGAILFDTFRASPARTRSFWGLRPQAPAYFSLAGKVGKRAHRGGTLSMGSLPYEPLPHDDTKGARPLWNPPHMKRSV